MSSLDHHRQVASGSPIGVELSYARFVGSRARLQCVVDEIVGEQLLENIDVSPPLDLFGISAHNGFRRVRYCRCTHWLTSWIVGHEATGLKARFWLEFG